MGFNLLEPVADVVKGCLLSAIVNQNDPHRTFIVGLCNRAEALLTCSIPDLELHFLTVNVDRLYFKINAWIDKSQFNLPMVGMWLVGKLSSENLRSMQDFPTEESPMIISLMRWSYCFFPPPILLWYIIKL
jgi:hypothetical protein